MLKSIRILFYMEVEYVIASKAAKVIVWLRNFLMALGLVFLVVSPHDIVL